MQHGLLRMWNVRPEKKPFQRTLWSWASFLGEQNKRYKNAYLVASEVSVIGLIFSAFHGPVILTQKKGRRGHRYFLSRTGMSKIRSHALKLPWIDDNKEKQQCFALVMVNLGCWFDWIEMPGKLVKHTVECICEGVSRNDWLAGGPGAMVRRFAVNMDSTVQFDGAGWGMLDE